MLENLPDWFLLLFYIKYHIMEYFRVAKFSQFCLKKHGAYFSRILIFRGWQRPRKIILIRVRKNCWVGGKTRLSLDRSTVRKKVSDQSVWNASNQRYLKQTKRTYFHSDGWKNDYQNKTMKRLSCLLVTWTLKVVSYDTFCHKTIRGVFWM